MKFLNSNIGYLIGSDKVYKTVIGGGLGVAFNSSLIPIEISLLQNYPNPFNPTTKINFDLKSSAFAMLRVYDITGREVRTLVNEKLSAGSYSYDFNASELPSGVYFYQLQTDGFIETKKMILLK
ncbi:MAG: T9SS type A sorting domain-containing protein [Ignavibacteria bacterium]|nr:T9SS type A sorting domain-containing protein [Ignavibacteria bacterium]